MFKSQDEFEMKSSLECISNWLETTLASHAHLSASFNETVNLDPSAETLYISIFLPKAKFNCA